MLRAETRTIDHPVEGTDSLRARESDAGRLVHGVAEGEGHVVAIIRVRLYCDVVPVGNVEL